MGWSLRHIQRATHIRRETAAGYLSRMGSTPDFPCPEVVIMDLNLPRGDGLDLLKQIRAHPECGKVPVVVMAIYLLIARRLGAFDAV